MESEPSCRTMFRSTIIIIMKIVHESTHIKIEIRKYGKKEQERSYRKQIVRQLRTQYVEGIYRPEYYTVTLKSRLRSLKVIESGTI